jgi:hypothetical protein
MVRSELSLKIEAAEGHVDMVKVLIKDLKLPGNTCVLFFSLNPGNQTVGLTCTPDPTKRKGLRQFAVNFSTNNQKINSCYDAHRQPPHTDFLVLAAIVNLWAKLGVDSILRDKLIANGAHFQYL